MTDRFISEVLGNTQWLDGGAMFGNAPRALWERWIKPDDKNRIPLQCRSILIEYGSKNILCETGIGAFFNPKLRERFGVEDEDHKLLLNLEALGIHEDQIDFVILSHLHFDHAGGLLPSWKESLGPAKRLLFPNAKYVVSSSAFERAIAPHPRDKSSFIPELPELLKASNRLIIVDESKHPDVCPELLSFSFSDGHTPGHMHTHIKGSQCDVVFAGDLIPGCDWIHLPITMGYDRFAERVIDEKKLFYETLLANSKPQFLFFTHDIKTAMATVIHDKDQNRYTVGQKIDAPKRLKF